ncbi:hypothetical protein [Pararhizobium sp.]|uniref:hypothetical protein n=1 Tax=Pararhizobium sp. TaxID=1977563 RepID=UPI003D12D1A0
MTAEQLEILGEEIGRAIDERLEPILARLEAIDGGKAISTRKTFKDQINRAVSNSGRYQ